MSTVIDSVGLTALRSLAAAVCTLHHAHQRGALVRIAGVPGGGWTVHVEAVLLGGRLIETASRSLTSALLEAAVAVRMDAPQWDVIHPVAGEPTLGELRS